MRPLAVRCTLGLLFTIMGCTDIGDVIHTAGDSVLTVRIGASGLFLTNKSGQTISVFLVEQQLSARLDWIPRCDGGNSITPGTTIMRPYAGVEGYAPGCTVLVYWWSCTQTFDRTIFVITVETGS